MTAQGTASEASRSYDPKAARNLLPPSLRFLCRALRWICVLTAVMTGLVLVVGFVAALVAIVVKPSQAVGVLGLSLMAIPVGGLLYGVLNADQMFGALRRGDFFTVHTATALRRFAVGMTVFKLSPVVILLPMMLLLRISGMEASFETIQWEGVNLRLDPGAVVDSDDNDMTGEPLVTLLFLGSIILFASVMERAAALAEQAERLTQENAQFV